MRATLCYYVVTTLVDEGLRMQECPGIFFADAPSGRRAGLVGSRLGIWEVIQCWKVLGQNRAALQNALPHLTSWQVDAALRYYARHPEEIDRAIADNERMAQDAERGLL